MVGSFVLVRYVHALLVHFFLKVQIPFTSKVHSPLIKIVIIIIIIIVAMNPQANRELLT